MSIAVTDRRPRVSRRPASPTLEDSLESWRAAIELAREQSSENRRCARRVRHEARDALGVVLFSAGASTGLTLVITLLVTLAG